MFGVISTWFAFDRSIALEGCWGRYEGLYSILYYLSVMLLSTFVSDKYKKVLVNCFLLCGAFQAVYAICQCFGWLNVKQVWHTEKLYDETTQAIISKRSVWVLGLTNNPNFFGTYTLICVSYAIGLFIDSQKFIKKFYYVVLIALFMFVLLASNATSAAVGFIFISLFILIYLIKNKRFVDLLVLALLLISITILVVKLGKTTLVKDVQQTGTEATEVAKGNLDDSYGTKRMFIWKKTVEIIPQHFWHGVGVDSFHKAFDGKALTRKKEIENKTILYDKAHNEYLQLLITQGIFALVVYVWLYGYVIFCGLKRSFKYNEIYLVLPIIGYLVQAFFNISVIEVAPFFWMALGLCAGRVDKIKKVIKEV